ncbi:MAG: hypothetical protein EP343_16600 [Deltaproteobacteria bacterium]|nr:MAG: hypothetical protein EP343_16600 [Deltaproteobacteria bacterium]
MKKILLGLGTLAMVVTGGVWFGNSVAEAAGARRCPNGFKRHCVTRKFLGRTRTTCRCVRKGAVGPTKCRPGFRRVCKRVGTRPVCRCVHIDTKRCRPGQRRVCRRVGNRSICRCLPKTSKKRCPNGYKRHCVTRRMFGKTRTTCRCVRRGAVGPKTCRPGFRRVCNRVGARRVCRCVHINTKRCRPGQRRVCRRVGMRSICRCLPKTNKRCPNGYKRRCVTRRALGRTRTTCRCVRAVPPRPRTCRPGTRRVCRTFRGRTTCRCLPRRR